MKACDEAAPENVSCTSPASARGHGLRNAFVGHVHDVDAGLGFQRFHGQVRLAAAAVRGVIELAGVGLGVGDQLLEVVGRHGRVGQQQLVEQHQLRDGREVLHRVVGQLGIEGAG